MKTALSHIIQKIWPMLPEDELHFFPINEWNVGDRLNEIGRIKGWITSYNPFLCLWELFRTTFVNKEHEVLIIEQLFILLYIFSLLKKLYYITHYIEYENPLVKFDKVKLQYSIRSFTSGWYPVCNKSRIYLTVLRTLNVFVNELEKDSKLLWQLRALWVFYVMVSWTR